MNIRIYDDDDYDDFFLFFFSKIRASAIESQIMRDKLRQYYDRNNFDKKLLEAELYTKMGNGVQTASKNLSSLSLN